VQYLLCLWTFEYDPHDIENFNHAFCAKDPWKLTLEVGVRFSIVFLISNFAVFWMLYAFFWVIPRRLNFMYRRFETLCLFHLHKRIGMRMTRFENVGVCMPIRLWRWNRQCSVTSAYKIQTPGNYPEESIQLFHSYNETRWSNETLYSKRRYTYTGIPRHIITFNFQKCFRSTDMSNWC
jgi:hypothetical protein